VFAWTVLALVFLDEVLAVVALGVWGFDEGGAWLGVLAPVAGVALWWTFASPKAPYGGSVTRPAVKVLVFGVATWGLWDAVVAALPRVPGFRRRSLMLAAQPPELLNLQTRGAPALRRRWPGRAW
jgi:hypothetical protein